MQPVDRVSRPTGIEKSTRTAQNLALVEEFASLLSVLPYSAKASLHHGSIRHALDKIGLPIGINNLHIAAYARSEGLTLVTDNIGEFERLPEQRTPSASYGGGNRSSSTQP